jgi:hypothetical protein
MQFQNEHHKDTLEAVVSDAAALELECLHAAEEERCAEIRKALAVITS